MTRPPLPTAAVLQMIADGHKDKEIADAYQVGPGVIQRRVLAIRGLLGARNRAEAVAIAFRRGLVK